MPVEGNDIIGGDSDVPETVGGGPPKCCRPITTTLVPSSCSSSCWTTFWSFSTVCVSIVCIVCSVCQAASRFRRNIQIWAGSVMHTHSCRFVCLLWYYGMMCAHAKWCEVMESSVCCCATVRQSTSMSRWWLPWQRSIIEHTKKCVCCVCNHC